MWGELTRPGRTEPTFSGPPRAVQPLEIVFVTSDDDSRGFCHALCDQEALRLTEVRITHGAGDEALVELIPKARLVVIATCRESVDKDSAAQKRERHASELARSGGVPVALLASQSHEAAQDHLALVRMKMPLVICPVHQGSFGQGFMDCFPLRTQFVERGDSPAHLEQIARELLKRSR